VKTEEVWIDIETATPEHMAMAFAHERNEILGRLLQIKNDLDHYNSYRNKDGKPLVFIFDFSQDVLEFLASGIGNVKKYLKPKNNLLSMRTKARG
jgi:hypothetical protein